MRIWIWLLLPVMPLAAQNYVQNGSFEKMKSNTGALQPTLTPCAFSSGPEVFNRCVDNWHTYKMVTPDIFLLDSAATCDKALPQPHSGQKMLGLIMYLPGSDGTHEYDYHEYVEGRLAKNLVPGKRYKVSFWVREGKKAGEDHLRGLGGGNVKPVPVNCGNFGFYFATEPSSEQENFRMSIFDFGIKPQVNFKEIVNTGDGWVKMSAVFVPDRAFRYFVFGNFFSDGVTPNDLPQERHAEIDVFNAQQGDNWRKKIRMAYYLFDDFSVVEAPDEVKPPPPAGPQVAQKFLKEKKITFSAAVLFEVDQAVLKPEAAAELNEVVKLLKGNPKIHLEIGGHTDNTGTPAHNLDLSERRAAAVRNYFVEHGIDVNRLSIKGYGADVPVADNTTPEGRSANRRVELKEAGN